MIVSPARLEVYTLYIYTLYMYSRCIIMYYLIYFHPGVVDADVACMLRTSGHCWLYTGCAPFNSI